MDFSKLLLEFVKIYVWISLFCYMDLSNKNTLKFDKDFKPCWSFCFESKVLKYSMPWVRCAFGKVLSSSCQSIITRNTMQWFWKVKERLFIIHNWTRQNKHMLSLSWIPILQELEMKITFETELQLVSFLKRHHII